MLINRFLQMLICKGIIRKGIICKGLSNAKNKSYKMLCTAIVY